MQIELTCSHGHNFLIDEKSASEDVRCPECNSLVESPENDSSDGSAESRSSKSLWEVMSGNQQAEKAGNQSDSTGSELGSEDSESEVRPSTSEPAETSETTDAPVASESSSESQNTAEDETESTPKSLWALMGSGAAPTETEKKPDKQEPEEEEESASAEEKSESTTSEEQESQESKKPAGLWSLMGVPQSPAKAEVSDTTDAHSNAAEEAESTEQDPPILEEEGEEYEEDDPDDWTSPGEWEQPVAPEFDAREAPTMATTITGRSIKSGLTKNALFALVLGLIAAPLSSLGTRPEFWAKLPATAVGLLALIFGMVAVGQVRASRGKITGAFPARLGMILGLLGIFLGPVHFNKIGEQNRLSSTRQITIEHLETIGMALSKYHDAYRHFPIGGIVDIEDGEDVPLHGWMSALLPYMGHQQLYRQIDFSQPFDAFDNKPAMSQQIPQFFAAEVEQLKNPQGFGVSHFAGVGGEANDPERGYLPLGIFSRNSFVSSDDIVDGLSQTLIAGEIANFYPAWGSPDNWRGIGDGLNKDYYGFGNADDTGALFLKADGSVRFFSNQTSVRILEKLSTRAGEEPIPEKYR